MINKDSYVVFWFRRDLRLADNCGLFHALNSGLQVIPLFIFDTNLLTGLDKKDVRINFIYQEIVLIKQELNNFGSDLIIKIGKPEEIFDEITNQLPVKKVFANNEYEPYTTDRDKSVERILQSKSIEFKCFKDNVIFEKNEILKPDNTPYTIFTPFYKQWLNKLKITSLTSYPTEELYSNFAKLKKQPFLPLNHLGFEISEIKFPEKKINQETITNYHSIRDFPFLNSTTHLGVHLRYGTISIRKLVQFSIDLNTEFLKELVWREFFIQIMWHFPFVATNSFKKKYDNLVWKNDLNDFEIWKHGQTGYPIVDAGMRQLLATGFMHNRVRMITASFLTKHLLIDWRLGEAWFAQHLLDYEQASNNGNWQWAAGTGCDAVPYFRIFNPTEQQKKFDPDYFYIKQWIPEFGSKKYAQPIIEHTLARKRTLSFYSNI